jgi:DNA-binding transcriptional regulator LsrR (DeoR family)
MPAKRARTNVHPGMPDQFLADVALAYYERHLTQNEIAALHGVSRSQVSRYLQEAHDRDIVQIRIVMPDSRDEGLEAELQSRFPDVKQTVVARVFSDRPEAMRRAVAHAGSALLDRMIAGGMTVCFGAGRTLAELVALLRPSAPNVTVVQAMGNAGHAGLDIDYHAIAQAAAGVFGGAAYQINAPAIVGAGARASELEASNPQIHESLEVARSADLYVLGIGTISSDAIYVRTGLITAEELESLGDLGAVGDICGNFFDVHGRPCPGPFRDRIVGIGFGDLHRANAVVTCATGIDKVPAIAGSLEGRLTSHLVTDELTARGVLAFTGGGSPSGAP